MLLLAPLLTYISVPFLIRLFPSVLTKFVYLNFCEYPGAVPAGRTPAGIQLAAAAPPKHGWDHAWCLSGTGTALIRLLLCRGLAEEARRDLFPCFASSNNVVLLTLFAAWSYNTPGHAQHQRGWKFRWEEVAEG